MAVLFRSSSCQSLWSSQSRAIKEVKFTWKVGSRKRKEIFRVHPDSLFMFVYVHSFTCVLNASSYLLLLVRNSHH